MEADWAIRLLSYASGLVSICSILHLILPAYEIFDDFPEFKKYYKVFVLIIGSIALNKRQSVVGIYKDRLVMRLKEPPAQG